MLFSANGFDERLTAVAKESGAQLYDLEQIVSAAELFWYYKACVYDERAVKESAAK